MGQSAAKPIAIVRGMMGFAALYPSYSVCRVGKAKRAHHHPVELRRWARRKCAFAHPCISALVYPDIVP